LLVEVHRVHAAHYGVYGARKVWLQLNREGISVARCTIERLYRANGWEGAQYGRKPRMTIPVNGHSKVPGFGQVEVPTLCGVDH